MLAKIEHRSGLPKWSEVAALVEALGGILEERAGSRIGVIHKGLRNDLRNFLVQAGVIE